MRRTRVREKSQFDASHQTNSAMEEPVPLLRFLSAAATCGFSRRARTDRPCDAAALGELGFELPLMVRRRGS